MTTEKRKYARIDAKNEYRLLKLLEENGSVSGDHYAFNDGWDDARIAKDIGCDPIAVAARRKAVFGKLAMTGREGSVKEPRFLALEQSAREMRVKCCQLENRVAALEKTINILISAGTKDGGPITSDMVRRLKDHFEPNKPKVSA